MTKDEAKAIISNQYNGNLNGLGSVTVNSVTYTFVDGSEIVSGLSYAKQISQILGKTTVKFKDVNNVYTLSMTEFDQLLVTLMLRGNTLWEKKIAKYAQIDASTTDAERDTIVNSAW